MSEHIDYIELPGGDLAVTKAFYSAAFGWGFTDYGPSYASFEDAGLNGGLRPAAEAEAGDGRAVDHPAPGDPQGRRHRGRARTRPRRPAARSRRRSSSFPVDAGSTSVTLPATSSASGRSDASPVPIAAQALTSRTVDRSGGRGRRGWIEHLRHARAGGAGHVLAERRAGREPRRGVERPGRAKASMSPVSRLTRRQPRSAATTSRCATSARPTPRPRASSTVCSDFSSACDASSCLSAPTPTTRPSRRALKERDVRPDRARRRRGRARLRAA